MFGSESGVEVNSVKILTTNGRGLTPEEVATLCVDRIISVSDTAPEPMRQQALAYKENIRQVLIHYMAMAAAGERTTLINKLAESGYEQAANILKEI